MNLLRAAAGTTPISAGTSTRIRTASPKRDSAARGTLLTSDDPRSIVFVIASNPTRRLPAALASSMDANVPGPVGDSRRIISMRSSCTNATSRRGRRRGRRVQRCERRGDGHMRLRVALLFRGPEPRDGSGRGAGLHTRGAELHEPEALLAIGRNRTRMTRRQLSRRSPSAGAAAGRAFVAPGCKMTEQLGKLTRALRKMTGELSKLTAALRKMTGKLRQLTTVLRKMTGKLRKLTTELSK